MTGERDPAPEASKASLNVTQHNDLVEAISKLGGARMDQRIAVEKAFLRGIASARDFQPKGPV